MGSLSGAATPPSSYLPPFKMGSNSKRQQQRIYYQGDAFPLRANPSVEGLCSPKEQTGIHNLFLFANMAK